MSLIRRPAKSIWQQRFEASPAGTHVFRKSDNQDLGAAPLDLQLPHNGPATMYVLRKDGFKDLDIETDLDNDHTLHVALEKEAPAPVAETSKNLETQKKKASTGGGGHKGGKHKGPGGPAPDAGALPCAAWETTRADGTCAPPGVATCGDGFTSDGNGGCNAVLPAQDCAERTMAVPGDTSCAAVGPVAPPKCPS